jgi:hypothetical protein
MYLLVLDKWLAFVAYESASKRSSWACKCPQSHVLVLPTVWDIHQKPQWYLGPACAHAAARPEVAGCKGMYQRVFVKHVQWYKQIHTKYLHQYIPIPPVLSCSSIGMYHEMFACKYTSIQATIHTNSTAKFPLQVLKWTRIGMYFCVYLYGLVCIWYVLVCIHDRFSSRVCGEHRWYWYVLCTYFGMYLLVFSGCICVCHVFVRIEVFGIVAPNTYWSMYWYVFKCIC